MPPLRCALEPHVLRDNLHGFNPILLASEILVQMCLKCEIACEAFITHVTDVQIISHGKNPLSSQPAPIWRILAFFIIRCRFLVQFSDRFHCVFSDQLWWRSLCSEKCAMEEADGPIPRAQFSVHLPLALTSQSRRPVTWSSQNDKPQWARRLAASRWRHMFCLFPSSALIFINFIPH